MGSIERGENKFGQKVVSLQVRGDGPEERAFAEIYCYGAHLCRWEENGSAPFLFLSEKAVLDGSKAIRGGIPVIFPQFAARGPLSKHGFAREKEWKVKSTFTDDSTASVTFQLEDDEDSRRQWPFQFSIEITFELKGTKGSTLSCIWKTMNKGREQFIFASALHTYFAIGDIEQCSVSDVSQIEYIDSLKNGERFTSASSSLKFSEEVDRIYCKAPNTILIEDKANGRVIEVHKEGMDDAVVWNPWIEKTKGMDDMNDEEYKVMICVEAGCIDSPMVLEGGQSCECKMHLSVRLL